MSWKHRITMLMLSVLTGLTVSGSVCAMVCDSASTRAVSHHGSGKTCEEMAAPTTGVQIRGVSEHDCSTHEAAVRHLITTTARRGDAVAFATPLAVAIVHVTIEAPANADSAFEYSAPPGTAPPTTTPLVLRV